MRWWLPVACGLLGSFSPAAAQVRSVAPAAPIAQLGGTAAGAAPLSAPAASSILLPAQVPPYAPAPLPLRYALTLNAAAPQLAAGGAFLADEQAQAWYRENRREAFPTLVARALAMNDWEQVLTAYEDPRLLREALLARADSSIGSRPAALLALVDRTPALAEKRRLFEMAVLDWSLFGPETLAAVAEAGISQESWERASLAERFEAMRGVYRRLAQAMIAVTPGHSDYAAQFKRALQRVEPLLSNEEIVSHAAMLGRAQRLAKDLKRARAAVDRADAAAARLLLLAETSKDIGQVEAVLGKLFPSLGLAPEAPPAEARHYDLSSAETQALADRLLKATVRLMRGTRVGDALLDELNGSGVTAGIAPRGDHTTIAHFEPETGRIVASGRALVKFAAALGRRPRDLLSDDEAVTDLAVVYSHIFVHETTHYRQHQRAKAAVGDASGQTYSQEWEMEAVAAQAAFLKEKRAADPAFAEREVRLVAQSGPLGQTMAMPEALAGDRARMRSWLQGGYSRVPTMMRVGARLIAAGIQADANSISQADYLNRELARRSRLPAAERRELEAKGLRGEALYSGTVRVEQAATGELRRLRAYLLGRAEAMVATVAELIKSSRTALEDLKR